MNRKKFLIKLVFLIFFIFLLNYLAMRFYWYSSVWYLDMFMHFLGGFWIGLAVLWFFKKEMSLKLIFEVVLSVLLIGILWEIFEIIIDIFITRDFFNILDTTSDIFFDLAGGSFALLYFFKKVMPIKENIVQ